ncbi:MAG: hypothetical protein AB8D78_02380 [Akkermansiaceae bacterium]
MIDSRIGMLAGLLLAGGSGLMAAEKPLDFWDEEIRSIATAPVGTHVNHPHFPALRSGSTAVSGATRQKQNRSILTFQTGKLWNVTAPEAGFTDAMTMKEGRHGGDGLTIGRKSILFSLNHDE